MLPWLRENGAVHCSTSWLMGLDKILHSYLKKRGQEMPNNSSVVMGHFGSLMNYDYAVKSLNGR